MHQAASLRRQIESALEQRIPGALTPRPRTVRELTATGIPAIDTLLQGGLPLGAITELVGPPCSGRTTLALSILAELTAAGKAVAWVDVADALDPESAAAAGVDLSRQLWVRCGAYPAASPPQDEPRPEQEILPKPGPPLLVEGSRTPAPSGGGGSPHPRSEARGLSHAVEAFMHSDTFARAPTPREMDMNRSSGRRNYKIGTPGAPQPQIRWNPG